MMITTAITGKIKGGKMELNASASLFEDGTEVILLPMDYWLQIAGSDSTRYQLEQAKEQIAEIRREPERAREILRLEPAPGGEVRK